MEVPTAHHHALRRAGVPVGLLAAPNARPSGSLHSPSVCAPNQLFKLLRCSAWLIHDFAPSPMRALVFRSAYSASRNARASAAFAASIKAHRAVSSETLMLQVRFAHPPPAHRTSSSSCSGVPVGFFFEKAMLWPFLQNARPSGSLRSPYGGRGKLRSPLHPSLLPPEMQRQTGGNPPLREKLSFGARHGFPFRSAYPQGGLVLPAHAAPTGGKTCSRHSRRNTLAAPGLFLLSYRSFFFSYFS